MYVGVLAGLLAAVPGARAEDASCPNPVMRDKAPLLRGIDEDTNLAYLLQYLVNCLRASNPYGAPLPGACTQERAACRTEFQHHTATLSEHDEAPFVGDIDGGWLGRTYTPGRRDYEAPTDDTFSCDESDPAALEKMIAGRNQIAAHHRAVLAEWDRWWVWANSVARACASADSAATDHEGGGTDSGASSGGDATGSGASTGGDGTGSGADTSGSGASTGSGSGGTTGSAEAVEQSTIGQAAAAGDAIDHGIALAAQMHGRGTMRFYAAFTYVTIELYNDGMDAIADELSFRRYHWLRASYDLGIEYGFEALAGVTSYHPPKLGDLADDDFFSTVRPQVNLWWHWVGAGAFVDWNAAKFNFDARDAFVPGVKAALALGGVARRAASLTLSTRLTVVGGAVVPAFRVLAHAGIINFIYEWQQVPTSGKPDGHVQIFALGFGVVE